MKVTKLQVYTPKDNYFKHLFQSISSKKDIQTSAWKKEQKKYSKKIKIFVKKKRNKKCSVFLIFMKKLA